MKKAMYNTSLVLGTVTLICCTVIATLKYNRQFVYASEIPDAMVCVKHTGIDTYLCSEDQKDRWLIEWGNQS